MKTAVLENKFGKVYSDLSVELPTGKQISKRRMQEIADELKGANRIHKPFILLMWTDAKNGKLSNWE